MPNLTMMASRLGIDEVGVINTDNVNAYYYPDSNRIAITYGMLKRLGEDQLATVIGHEIAHLRGVKNESEADDMGLAITLGGGYKPDSRTNIIRVLKGK